MHIFYAYPWFYSIQQSFIHNQQRGAKNLTTQPSIYESMWDWIEWNIVMQLYEHIYNFPLIIISLSKLTIVCNILCELIISFSRNLKFSKKKNSKNKILWKKTRNIIACFRLLYFRMWNLQNNIVSPHYNVDLAMVLQYTRFQATITRNYQDFNFKISLIRTPIWLQC
jgi:hypothetical protein